MFDRVLSTPLDVTDIKQLHFMCDNDSNKIFSKILISNQVILGSKSAIQLLQQILEKSWNKLLQSTKSKLLQSA